MLATPGRISPKSTASYLGLVVLEPVSLVHHEAGPLDGAQDGLVDGDELIGGEQHVEFDLHLLLWEKARTWKEMAGTDRQTNQRAKDRAEKVSGDPTSIPGNPGGTNTGTRNFRAKALCSKEGGVAEDEKHCPSTTAGSTPTSLGWKVFKDILATRSPGG